MVLIILSCSHFFGIKVGKRAISAEQAGLEKFMKGRFQKVVVI